MGVLIGEMTQDDVPAVAHCHVECRREAFSALVPPEDLAPRLHVPRWEQEWAQMLSQSTTPVWIGRQGASVLGFSHAGLPREEFSNLPALELYLMYVRESTYGTGLASALLARAIGREPAWLWTYERNVRAQRFYAKHGFTATGVTKVAPSSRAVTEIQMTRF
jgi:GNAT superfamily N-acetyltransferase